MGKKERRRKRSSSTSSSEDSDSGVSKKQLLKRLGRLEHLVPVSSTVIPLPVYQVGYGLNLQSAADEKTKKPNGPIQLVTVYSKKKPFPVPKAKSSDVSIVKPIFKQEYDN